MITTQKLFSHHFEISQLFSTTGAHQMRLLTNDSYWLLPGGLYTTTSPIPRQWKFSFALSVTSPVTAFPQQKALMWPSSLVEINLLKWKLWRWFLRMMTVMTTWRCTCRCSWRSWWHQAGNSREQARNVSWEFSMRGRFNQRQLHLRLVVDDNAGVVARIIVAVEDGSTCVVGSVPPVPWVIVRVDHHRWVWPVVEVHALHGQCVGARLLVLQDPRLRHHHHADVMMM